MPEEMTLEEAIVSVLRIAELAARRAETFERNNSWSRDGVYATMSEENRADEKALRMVAEAAKDPMKPLRFILELQAKSRADDNNMTQSLVANLEHRLAFAEAKNELVQIRLDRLLMGPWTAPTAALETARDPSDEHVEMHINRKKG